MVVNKTELITSVMKCDWNLAHELLQNSLTTLNKVKKEKNVLQEDVEVLCEVLRVALPNMKDDSSRVLPVVTECVRLLRNGCVNSPEFQTCVVMETPVLGLLYELLDWLAGREGDQQALTCIQVAVQFLGNTVVGNVSNQAHIWRKFSGMLINFLNFHDVKVVNFTAMVIYNILLGCPNVDFGIETHGIKLFESLIDHAMKDSEFALFMLELFLKKERFMLDIYGEVGVEHRLFLLETVHGMLVETQGKVPTQSVCFLAEQLKQRSDHILKTCEVESVDQLEPREVTRLLELLASASGENPYLECLQKDVALLIDCTLLLRSIHSLGRSGDNNFTAIQKLSELSVASRSMCVEDHPAFGFKVGLVRLLANLCWKNKKNQDMVREMDGIPLLLDCCNIDARNPLIIQWVVFAVRNLCEDNQNNQAVIATMNHQGVVDGALLREIGLTLHQEGDDKIVVMPYK